MRSLLCPTTMISLSSNIILVTLVFTSVRIWIVGAVHHHPSKAAVLKEGDKRAAPVNFGRRMQDLPLASFNATKDSVDDKLGTILTDLSESSIVSSSSDMIETSSSETENFISVDITFTTAMDNASAKEALSKAAVQVAFINCFYQKCSAKIPVRALKDVASIDLVHLLHPAEAKTQVGSVTSEGDRAMFADIARSKYKVNGSGLLIGVLSDSYNCLGGASNDTLSRDLPDETNSIVVLADLSPEDCIYGLDEGRAMMQLIHDVAPGARLAFRTAFRGDADFAAGILELAAAGCDIIVDDIIYFAEPMFQDGIIAQAVNQVVSQGVPYFTAAGNAARDAWVAPSGFIPILVDGLEFHQFGLDINGSPIISMRIGIQGYSIFIFQWDEPYASVSGAPGSLSDLDIYFVLNNEIVARSEDLNIGRDPFEGFGFSPSDYSTDDTVTVDFFIIKRGGPPPSYIKLLAFSYSPIFEFATNSATSYGHMNAAQAAGVGAARYTKTTAFGVSPPEIESFSSAGGTPILLATDGTRLSSPEIRNQPRFTGPDGGATTFFYQNDGGVFRFYGTSASAPHVAAVAALMLEYKGGPRSLSPAEIYNTLAMTAIDMDDPFTAGFDVGFDFGTGAGLVNASAALHELVDCTITFNLYNSRTDSLVTSLTNGTTIANPPPCRRLNIEAVVPCANGSNVTLELYRGSQLTKRKTEYFVPYFLFGNDGRNVYDGRIKPGTYGIRARVANGVWSPFTNFTLGGRCD
jgi:subtilisin family serine protease